MTSKDHRRCATDRQTDVLKAVGEAVGSTVNERMPVGDMGFAAYFKDTEGNLIGSVQPASEAPAVNPRVRART